MTPSSCSIAGCSAPHRARGWCNMHYHSWARHGDPETAKRGRGRRVYEQCQIEGCDNPHLARGWCKKHYYRWSRQGDPTIVLTNNVPKGAYGDCPMIACDKRAVVKGLCQGHYLSYVIGPKRRAQKSGAAVNDFTPEQWRGLLKETAHTCAYCGTSDVILTQDHIIPLSRGGSHTASNIVPACQRCNSSKGTSLLEEWVVQVAA